MICKYRYIGRVFVFVQCFPFIVHKYIKRQLLINQFDRNKMRTACYMACHRVWCIYFRFTQSVAERNEWYFVTLAIKHHGNNFSITSMSMFYGLNRIMVGLMSRASCLFWNCSWLFIYPNICFRFSIEGYVMQWDPCSCLTENNINWRDVKRKNVVNNVYMSSLRAPWRNGALFYI